MSDPARYAVAVVGGGPAGLAAAEVLAEAGHAVTVYDRMPTVGRKLLMAGRGGLNLTHSEPLERFLERYHPGSPALLAAVRDFPPDSLRGWCEGLGEPTIVGSSGRVFPKSFKASPLLRAWLARLASLGVAFRQRHRLVGLRDDGIDFGTPDGRVAVTPSASLLALGGASWPRLGSDGAWAGPLAADGIGVSPLKPANVGFTVPWSAHFAERFAGTPLKRTGLALGDTRTVGEAMIAREGIEGGAIYALSRDIRETIASFGQAFLDIDLRPDLSEEAIAERLNRRRSGESLSTSLRKSAGLAPVAAGLLREAHGKDLPHQPDRLAALIKKAPLRLMACRPIDRAISTAGGVRFDAIDERFMLLAKPGVFVAGEMLDWEAPTGGYLLQGCFATGRAAANGMIAWLAARSPPLPARGERATDPLSGPWRAKAEPERG